MYTLDVSETLGCDAGAQRVERVIQICVREHNKTCALSSLQRNFETLSRKRTEEQAIVLASLRPSVSVLVLHLDLL